MKKTGFLFLFISFFVVIYGQNFKETSQVPVVVSSKLDNLYPQHEQAKWYTDGSQYMAKFTLNGLSTRVYIMESGRWVETQQDYFIENCPRNMQKHISQEFAGYNVKSITRVDNKDKSEFRVELEQNNIIITATYDASGKYVEQKSSQNQSQDLTSQGGNTQKEKKLPVHPKELPSNITSYIMKNYPGYSIKECYILNDETYRNAYHVILSNSAGDMQKLWFDFQGILIKVESKEVLTSQNEQKQAKNEKKSDKKTAKQRVPIPESKVPTAALDYFNKKAKKSENVRWDTINKEYVVSYVDPVKNNECRMHFDQKGNFLKQVTLIPPKSLAPQIVSYIQKNYPGLDLHEAQNVVTADKKKYILVLIYSPTWINDPMVYHELYFSGNGKLENEILADYIDENDEYFNKLKQEKETYFIEYLDQDNPDISDPNLIDGQPVYLKDLPSIIINHLKTNYPDYSFKEGIIITENNQLIYSLIIKKQGYKERKRVFYDIKGKFVREENVY
ncbi:MAG: PepSY-like domain-containing protein [Bacteroidales bacterium]|nr:PepSY-like domain-containing protein [Bacteroidales bacterium]